jgi:hypothetical protein
MNERHENTIHHGKNDRALAGKPPEFFAKLKNARRFSRPLVTLYLDKQVPRPP